jgi:hypothetical protein
MRIVRHQGCGHNWIDRVARRFAVAGCAAAFLIGPIAPAMADYITVDISSVVNGSISINADSIPTGTTAGNQGTPIPFTISTYQGVAGAWFAAGSASPGTSSTLTFNLSGLDISGQQSFYALLNNYFGTAGEDEYDITVTATNNDSVTYQSIGGVDTRDYNANSATTGTIAGTTTPWFNNGIGQRLDVREFVLPASFATETLASFNITQLDSSDPAFLSGLTFSDQAASLSVPEPGSLVLLAAGLAGTAAARRRRR